MDRPAVTLKLKIGGRYRLRNGSRIIITDQREATFIEGRSKKQMTLPFWIGQLRGHAGEKLTWQDDGRYSPVAKSPLDIVAATK